MTYPDTLRGLPFPDGTHDRAAPPEICESGKAGPWSGKEATMPLRGLGRLRGVGSGAVT